MTDPPLETGAVKATVAVDALVAVAVSTMGIEGAAGEVVIVFEESEAREIPTPFVAVTVKV